MAVTNKPVWMLYRNNTFYDYDLEADAIASAEILAASQDEFGNDIWPAFIWQATKYEYVEDEDGSEA
jgi:hypothetical protein